MCVREGKEFEELFPHLGRVCVLKSPFNRGAVTDDDDSILSVLRQTEPDGTRRGKKAEPPLEFGEEGMCRHRPSNLHISTLNRTFMESVRQLKRGKELRTTSRQGSMSLVSINIVMALPRPRLIHLSGRPT